ncbi:MAG: DUF881 domain-containing protein [Actinomycetota bacterium]
MSGRSSPLGFSIVLLVLGFLVSTGFVQERLRESQNPTRRHELEALVRERRTDVGELAAEVAELSGRLSAIQSRLALGSSRVRDIADQAERLRAAAGVTGARGPGVVVELADSPRAPSTQGEAADLRIQDVDLQLVVNTLWRAGAEAVAVNGRRVVSTTAIRQAGGTILVNYRAVTSPYRVVAIGGAEALHDHVTRSELADRFGVWTEVYGLRFSVERVGETSVPGLRGVPAFRWARPVKTAG